MEIHFLHIFPILNTQEPGTSILSGVVQIMRATSILYRQCVRLTLFTRPNCSLCDDAKAVLSKVWDKKPFEYDEMNVMEHPKWKALYEFDTPVVRAG